MCKSCHNGGRVGIVQMNKLAQKVIDAQTCGRKWPALLWSNVSTIFPGVPVYVQRPRNCIWIP